MASRLPADLPSLLIRTPRGDQRQVGETRDLYEGTVDTPGQVGALPEVSLALVDAGRPHFDNAKVHQRDRPAIVAERDIGRRLRLDRLAQPLGLPEDTIEVSARTCERQAYDRQLDPEAPQTLVGHRLRVPLGHANIRRGVLERSSGQFAIGREQGQFRLGGQVGREDRQQRADRRILTVESN